MRDLFILAIVLAILIRTMGAAQAGILGWTWLTLMTPQKLAWGLATELPLNLILAIVTFAAWLLSREPKRISLNPILVLWSAFIAYITLTTFLALAPDLAWPRWNLAVKVMVLGLMIPIIMTNQVRIQALIWIMALALGYFGIKGGIFTLVTGGHFRVLPPAESFGDSNDLALALCMILPLMNYLRLQSANRFTRYGIIAGMGLTALGVLGTYSRGGLIGLTIMGIYLWWRSRNRLAIALLLLVVIVPAYEFMPANWTERMSTIESAGTDQSFQDRLQAWQTEFNIAKARPLTGGGFNASESPTVYKTYSPDPSGWPRAAHSIYFQVLGDHGFVGLALYLGLLGMTWQTAAKTRRKARRAPQLGWIADLASMIQVSLISFMVAGAGLSMAYYDVLYLLVGVTIGLRKMVLQPSPIREAEPLMIRAARAN